MKKYLLAAILLLPLTATAEDSIDCTFVEAGMQCTLVLDDTFNAISVLEGEQAVQNDRIDELEASNSDCEVGNFTPGRWLMDSAGVTVFQHVFWFDTGVIYATSSDFWINPSFAYGANETTPYVTPDGVSVPAFVGTCATPPAGVSRGAGWYSDDPVETDQAVRDFYARYGQTVARLNALEAQFAALDAQINPPPPPPVSTVAVPASCAIWSSGAEPQLMTQVAINDNLIVSGNVVTSTTTNLNAEARLNGALILRVRLDTYGAGATPGLLTTCAADLRTAITNAGYL